MFLTVTLLAPITSTPFCARPFSFFAFLPSSTTFFAFFFVPLIVRPLYLEPSTITPSL